MIQGNAIQTVDPRYIGLLRLMYFLNKMEIIEIGQTKHSFSPLLATIKQVDAKPHWIPMAVVSLSLDYMEIYPIGKKYAK